VAESRYNRYESVGALSTEDVCLRGRDGRPRRCRGGRAQWHLPSTGSYECGGGDSSSCEPSRFGRGRTLRSKGVTSVDSDIDLHLRAHAHDDDHYHHDNGTAASPSSPLPSTSPPRGGDRLGVRSGVDVLGGLCRTGVHSRVPGIRERASSDDLRRRSPVVWSGAEAHRDRCPLSGRLYERSVQQLGAHSPVGRSDRPIRLLPLSRPAGWRFGPDLSRSIASMA
jgi:hypothetical protein